MKIEIKKGRWFYHLIINGECVKCSGNLEHIHKTVNEMENK